MCVESTPRKSTHAHPTAALTPNNRRPHGILVVDDEPIIRDLLKQALGQQGWQVWTAVNRETAERCYTQQQAAIDLVLLDLRLRCASGLETLDCLRTINPRLVAALMSGADSEEFETELESRGVVRFFRKPFHLLALTRTLTEIVERA